jgi:hypothetical protein
MDSFAQRLRRAVEEDELRLRAISEELADSRPEREGAWSKKQELGHLIDSATNNRVRFIKAALEDRYDGPSYDGRGWVDLGGYAEMRWIDLIDIWKTANAALAAVLERIPHERMAAECRVGNAEPVTLELLIDDYLLHMQHHLEHILPRNRLGAYPGSTAGV